MHGPRFQVVLYKCEACGGATVGQEGTAAPPSLEARAACDAEEVALGSDAKARKTIPPKVRRGVLLRDGLPCVVPGCTNRLWLEVHHLVPRAAGGSNEAGNLATLCSTHHGLVHEGNLRHMPGEDGRLRWFGRTGREIGRATHVGRRAGAGVGDNGSPIGATAPASAAATAASPAA